MGLALVKDKEVVEAHSQIKFTGSVNTNTKFQGFSDAYYEGHEDGERFSISDKIAEGDAPEILALASNQAKY